MWFIFLFTDRLLAHLTFDFDHYVTNIKSIINFNDIFFFIINDSTLIHLMANVYDEYIINNRVISSLFVMNQLLLQKKYLNNKICIS